jgi:hypothetical protein
MDTEGLLPVVEVTSDTEAILRDPPDNCAFEVHARLSPLEVANKFHCAAELPSQTYERSAICIELFKNIADMGLEVCCIGNRDMSSHLLHCTGRPLRPRSPSMTTFVGAMPARSVISAGLNDPRRWK